MQTDRSFSGIPEYGNHLRITVVLRHHTCQFIQEERALTRVEHRIGVHQAILQQRVADPEGMREQLTHLLDLSDRRRTTLRVLSFDTSVFRAQVGSFVLFDLGEPFGQVAYAENLVGCLDVEAPAVDRYLDTYADIRRAALTEPESRTLIKRTIKDWK